tara:strand:+ start:2398 stop:2607 length:210 start_codon:yes stop_codon:yes gene_type:complete
MNNLEVGDLVRIRDYDWISRAVGVVLEVRELIHDQSDASYTAVTALVAGREYTFSAADFELVNKVERKK